MATKFYKCAHCGNVIQKVVDSKVPVVCCGEKMQELIPGTVDASVEKHLPVLHERVFRAGWLRHQDGESFPDP